MYLPKSNIFSENDSAGPYDLMKRTAYNTEKQLELLKQIQMDSEKESEKNRKRFIIQTVLSVAALTASSIAAVAAIIALM